MVRRPRQVESIAARVGGHHLMLGVRPYDLRNGRLNGQKRQIANKFQPFRTASGGPLASSSSTAGLVTSS